MSDIDNTFQDDGDPAPTDQSNENPNIRQLRQQASKVGELEAKLAKYEQAETVRSAGLDLTEIQQKALLGAHSGELTPETLRATAEQLGFATPSAQPAQAPGHAATVSPEEQAGHAASASAATGATAPGNQSAEDLYQSAKNPAELTALIRANGGQIAGDNE